MKNLLAIVFLFSFFSFGEEIPGCTPKFCGTHYVCEEEADKLEKYFPCDPSPIEPEAETPEAEEPETEQLVTGAWL